MPAPQIQTSFNAAIQHFQAGRVADAQRLFREILAANPRHAESLHWLGVTMFQSAQFAAAAEVIGKAVAIDERNFQYRCNLGLALHNAGNIDAAIPHYERAIALKPDFAEAFYNLGVARSDQGRLEDAVTQYRQAVALKPDFVAAHFNLGNMLRRLGKNQEAVLSFERAIALQPDHAEAQCNLGEAFFTLKDLDRAEVQYRRAIALRADFPYALNNLGTVLHARHNDAEALPLFARALALKPSYADAHYNMGLSLQHLDRLDEAATYYERAIAHNPNYVKAHTNLGVVREFQGRIVDAMDCYEQALRVKPNHAPAHGNLGNVLLEQGKVEDAIAHHERAVALRPDWESARTNLIFALNFDSRADVVRQQNERRLWSAAAIRHGAVAGPARLPTAADRTRAKLRIGYASGHFRHQAAAYAFAPAILHHSRERFEVFCYSDTRAEDDVTAQLKAAATAWRDTRAMSDEQMADQIRADGIDILIDCSGHMEGARLLVFARKPAPIQASAWGEPTGSGLATMDYVLADPVFIPAAVRPLLTEAVIDLPCLLGYWNPDDVGPPGPAPALASGQITFGSFNRAAKLTEPTLALWAKLLSAVPGSRLLLKDKTWRQTSERNRLMIRMAHYGVDATRVEFVGPGSRLEHFAAYRSVDIGLDPQPHSGGMTALDALWMGVPTITVPGPTPSSRTAAAVLSAIGLSELIADGNDDYVAKAAALAADLPRLAAYHAELRDRLMTSVVGDPLRYAAAVEAGYEEMFARWCG